MCRKLHTLPGVEANRTAAVSVVGGQCSHLLGMSFCLKSVSLHKWFDQFQPSPFEASQGLVGLYEVRLSPWLRQTGSKILHPYAGLPESSTL